MNVQRSLSPPSIPWLRCTLSKEPTPNCSPGRHSINGCPLLWVCSRWCVCVFTAVCVHFGWVNAEHNILSMGPILGCMVTSLTLFTFNTIDSILANDLHILLVCEEYFLKTIAKCNKKLMQNYNICWNQITRESNFAFQWESANKQGKRFEIGTRTELFLLDTFWSRLWYIWLFSSWGESLRRSHTSNGFIWESMHPKAAHRGKLMFWIRCLCQCLMS